MTGALLVTRVAFLAPLAYLPRLVRAREAGRTPWQGVAVVWWAGTRGVVPLAAALSIPLTGSGGGGFPERDLLLVLATSCIILTLVVQGFTLQPLVRRLGVSEDPARAAREEAVARHRVALAARARRCRPVGCTGGCAASCSPWRPPSCSGSGMLGSSARMSGGGCSAPLTWRRPASSRTPGERRSARARAAG